jgi:hypothetical protein
MKSKSFFILNVWQLSYDPLTPSPCVPDDFNGVPNNFIDLDYDETTNRAELKTKDHVLTTS